MNITNWVMNLASRYERLPVRVGGVDLPFHTKVWWAKPRADNAQGSWLYARGDGFIRVAGLEVVRVPHARSGIHPKEFRRQLTYHLNVTRTEVEPVKTLDIQSGADQWHIKIVTDHGELELHARKWEKLLARVSKQPTFNKHGFTWVGDFKIPNPLLEPLLVGVIPALIRGSEHTS